jgi:hypothetical protein
VLQALYSLSDEQAGRDISRPAARPAVLHALRGPRATPGGAGFSSVGRCAVIAVKVGGKVGAPQPHFWGPNPTFHAGSGEPARQLRPIGPHRRR